MNCAKKEFNRIMSLNKFCNHLERVKLYSYLGKSRWYSHMKCYTDAFIVHIFVTRPQKCTTRQALLFTHLQILCNAPICTYLFLPGCWLQMEMTAVWHIGRTRSKQSTPLPPQERGHCTVAQQCEHQKAALLLYSQGQLAGLKSTAVLFIQVYRNCWSMWISNTNKLSCCWLEIQ